MEYSRAFNLKPLLAHRSLFLFGPRQTGKTTYLRETFPQARYIDLLDARTFRELSARPELLRDTLRDTDKLVVIDEIQKLPALLDEVHLLIERDKSLRFIMTGSSARKLKRGSANLLAGRALTAHMHPLISKELGFKKLEMRLTRGSLPAIIDSPIYLEDLEAYVGTYLKEEIQAEGLTRNIANFSRFLEVAAISNGLLLNFSEIGRDAGIAPRTVQNFYQILEDTLTGYQLVPYQKTKKRKAISTAKFYLFDIGVAHRLVGRNQVSPKTPEYGAALEHLIFLELRAYLDYTRNFETLTFWRTRSKYEVDFLVGNSVAIEVKSKKRITSPDLKGLRALSEEVALIRKIVVANELWPRKTENNIEVIPVEEFLVRLWSGDIIA